MEKLLSHLIFEFVSICIMSYWVKLKMIRCIIIFFFSLLENIKCATGALIANTYLQLITNLEIAGKSIFRAGETDIYSSSVEQATTQLHIHYGPYLIVPFSFVFQMHENVHVMDSAVRFTSIMS